MKTFTTHGSAVLYDCAVPTCCLFELYYDDLAAVTLYVGADGLGYARDHLDTWRVLVPHGWALPPGVLQRR